jgi:hypothetical protein
MFSGTAQVSIRSVSFFFQFFECLEMTSSSCRQVNWGNCGIPWVNCSVLCVKDDRQNSSEPCTIVCQNCAVYSVFPSGMTLHIGYGGLVVTMLASGTQDRGFEPGRSRRVFSDEKIHSMPSFGGEVKPSVPCRRFAACKRTLRFTWKSESQTKLTGHFSPNSVLH